MPVFTVHMPFVRDHDTFAAERSVFVRDGFHFWAMIFGPLWLLVHRLWLAALGYLILLFGLERLLIWLRISTDIRVLVMVLLALLLGFEAASLWRWSRSRGRWREVGLVVASDRETAERRFFAQWTGEESAGVVLDRAPSRSLPRPAAAPDDVVGLFPRPGGRS